MNRKLLKVSIIVIGIISVINILTFTNEKGNLNIAFYKENEKIGTIPEKNNSEHIVFDHAECDNGASILWNEEEWAPLVKNLNKSKTKCSLYFNKNNAVYYIKKLEIEEKNKENPELMYDDTKDRNLRYVGSYPNNYIDIGDRDSEGNPILWRIIGVMNNVISFDNEEKQESLLKIVRANSIGGYNWDTSALEVNGGEVVNEWSQADLMKLLNPKEVYNNEELEIGGSLYWNKEKGECYHGINNTHIPCDFTSSGISEEAKENIVKVRWNTGASYEKGDTTNANFFYDKERSNHNGKELCANNDVEWCNDEVERTTTWDGYIGLMYPSDYGFAVDSNLRQICLNMSLYSYENNNCSEKNWLKINNYFSLTPTARDGYARNVYIVRLEGRIGQSDAKANHYVFPTAYLKSSLYIKTNPYPEQIYGSENSPFILDK